MLTVVQNACNNIILHSWGVGTGHITSFSYIYIPYINNPNVRLLARLRFTGDTTQSICNPQTFQYQVCIAAFMDVVDDCDALDFHGDNWGGWAYDPCFQWTVDANPGVSVEGTNVIASGLR
ncbi:hypothetical protein LTR65_003646 [Meristemomyces frigidus]